MAAEHTMAMSSPAECGWQSQELGMTLLVSAYPTGKIRGSFRVVFQNISIPGSRVECLQVGLPGGLSSQWELGL